MGASVQRKMTASCGFAACGMQQTYDAGQPYQSEDSCKVQCHRQTSSAVKGIDLVKQHNAQVFMLPFKCCELLSDQLQVVSPAPVIKL